MVRLITLLVFTFLTAMAYSQNFPDAQRQPKFKESHARQKHYAKQAHRRHIRRGTAFSPDDLKMLQPKPVYMLADRRKIMPVV
jgi:hypothetical protein